MWFSRPKGRRNFFRKAQMAPYQARRFRNPYFQQKNQRSKLPFAITGMVIGLLVALTSFFFTAPIFAITALRVEGAETVNPKDIRNLAEDYLAERAWLIFKKNNRFLFDEKELAEKLQKNYAFSALEIGREGQTLAVVFKEKVSSFLWLTTDLAYLLDNTGAVIRLTSSEETEAIMKPPQLYGVTKNGAVMPESVKLLVFKDLADNPVVIGQAVLSEVEVKNTRLFFETLQAAGVLIERFEFNREVGTWFKAVTSDDFEVLFDPNIDILKQADNVLLLLHDQIKDRSALEYIDVRFGDHVYYK